MTYNVFGGTLNPTLLLECLLVVSAAGYNELLCGVQALHNGVDVPQPPRYYSGPSPDSKLCRFISGYLSSSVFLL